MVWALGPRACVWDTDDDDPRESVASVVSESILTTTADAPTLALIGLNHSYSLNGGPEKESEWEMDPSFD